MSPRQLLRSSTFRLALLYQALFTVSALALLGFIHVATTTFMERQTDAVIQAEITGLAEQYRIRGVPGLRAIIERRAASAPNRASIYLLVDPAGRPVTGNIDRWPQVEADEAGMLAFTVDVRRPDEPVEQRRAVAKAFRLPEGGRLLVGRSIEERLRVQELMDDAIAAGIVVILLLGTLAGYLVSRWTSRRVETVNRAARQIMAGDLSRRIPERGSGDEFDDLVRNLNAMLERIERLMEGLRAVTSNIAHDLRTPLSRMRARLEVALMRDPDAEESQELLQSTLQDAEALINTFNAILDIARAEAGAAALDMEPVDLAEVTADVVDLYGPLAEDRHIQLETQTDGAPTVKGNRHLIAQALANLVDNAIKYAPAESSVLVAARGAPHASLIVADNGPGIPPDRHEQALERFTRLDPDRSTPGNGLGLSLVAAVAKLHDAKLELEDNGPGLRVRLMFDKQSDGAKRRRR